MLPRFTLTTPVSSAAVTKPELGDLYLRRFHRAMDALKSQEEGEAVYDRCRGEGWYEFAAKALGSGPGKPGEPR